MQEQLCAVLVVGLGVVVVGGGVVVVGGGVVVVVLLVDLLDDDDGAADGEQEQVWGMKEEKVDSKVMA